MIMSYILVYQHKNVIYWSLKQLNMFLFLKKKSYNQSAQQPHFQSRILDFFWTAYEAF